MSGATDFSGMSTSELAALVEEMSEDITNLEDEAAFYLWKPYGYQREWIESPAQIRCCLAANQIGKSEAMLCTLLMECLGTKPKALGGDGKWRKNSLRGKRVIACGETFEISVANLVKKLDQFLVPAMLIKPPKKNSIGIPTIYQFVTGAELTFQSYSSPVGAFEGSTLDFAAFDEPPPEDLFNAVRRGTMRKKGRIMITATPLKEPWLLDSLIIPSQDENSANYGVVDYFRNEIWDACEEHAGGHLPHAQIEAFLETLPESERTAREKGLFLSLQGLEFPYVNADDHVVPDFEVYRSWPIVEVVDPAAKRGLTVIWAAVSPTEEWYVFRAAQIPNDGFKAMCQQIKRIRSTFSRQPDLCIMDARGGAQAANLEAQQTWFQLFADYGLQYEPSVESPLQQLHDWMRPQWPEHGSAAGKGVKKPKLRLLESVTEMKKGPWWSLQRFVWSPQASQKRWAAPEKDFIDCLRYLAGHPKASWKRLSRMGENRGSVGIANSYATKSRQTSPRRSRRGRMPSARTTPRY